MALVGSGLNRGPLTLGPVSGGGFDFGNILLGATSEQGFVVSNASDLPSGPLTVHLNSAGFSVLETAQSGCVSAVTELLGGSRCQLSLGFAPERRGATEVTVTVDSALGAVSARLVGRGRAPAQLTLSTDALDFEQVVLGRSNTAAARIENTGDEPLSLSSLGLAGEHVVDFAIQDSDCGSGTSLAGLERCSVALEFRPVTSAGLRAAALQVTSSTGQSLDVALRGEALALGSLQIEAAEAAVGTALNAAFGDFGVTPVDEVSLRTYRVSNPSAQPSGALSLTTGGAFALISPASAGDCQPQVSSLVNGESCTVSISFAPTQRELLRSTLLVSSPLAGSSSLSLFGAGAAPGRWAAAQREVDFGHLVVGTTASNTLTLHNGGDTPTPPLEARLSGALGGETANFSFDASPCASALAPGASCSLGVRFSPSEPATQWATLELASGGISETSVLLFGEALPAGGLVVAAADTLGADFGDVERGTTLARSFTITNPGALDSGAVTVTVSSQDGSFTLADVDCAATGPRGLLEGASCSVNVSFQPIGSGPASANLLVNSDAVGSAGLQLTGRGRTPPSLVATGNRSFGTAHLDSQTLTEESNQFVWTLTNAGDLGSGPLQLENDNPTEFVVLEDSCAGVALDGLASCQISVRFQPSDAGQRLGELCITDGASGASVTLAMSGTGVRVAQPGQSCINASCATGTCTGGVCCDRDCSATCQTCASGVCIDQQNRESCGDGSGQCFGVNRCQLPAGQRCSGPNGDAQCGDGNCEVRLSGQGTSDRVCCLESCAGADQCSAQTGRCQAPALSQGAACGAPGQQSCAAGLVCKTCLNGGSQCTPADVCCGGCALDQSCEAGQCQCPVQSNGRREIHCGGGRCITDRPDACCDTGSGCDGNQICDAADDLCECPAGSRECVANSNDCVPNNQCCSSCGACATCNGGACTNLSRGSPGQCNSTQRCDGNGACFTPQCTQAEQCGDCRTCSSLSCVQAPPRTPCSQNRLCTAAGQCVRCINSNDCPTGQTCDSSNTCVNACTPSTEVCDGRDNDCDGQIDDNPNVSSDPNNCGACGRNCQGGTCVSGQCQPFALVSGRTSPNDILVDNNNVYWIDASGVNRFPKNGGTNSTVTTIASTGALSLQRDGSTLYWGASNDVFRAAVTATAADSFLPNQAGNIRAVYHTPGFIYWSEDRGPSPSGNGLRSTAVARANLQNLVTETAPGVSVNGSRPLGVQGECFWSAEPETEQLIGRGCPGNNGILDGLFNAFFPFVVRGMHVSGPQFTDVYIGALGRGLVRLGSAQIPEAVIVPSTGPMGAVLRDGDFVYFVDGASATQTCTANGIVSRVTTGGENRTALSAAQSCLAKIAVDNASVYWTNFQSGQVMKLAKPAQ